MSSYAFTSAAYTLAVSTLAFFTSALLEIGDVLSRLGGCKNNQTRFLGGRKIRRARFKGLERYITGDCNSLGADCERADYCWRDILRSIGCKGFRIRIDDFEDIIVLEGL